MYLCWNTARLQLLQIPSVWPHAVHVLVAEGINPDVALEAFHLNITSLSGFEAFKDSLCHSGGSEPRVDLLLSCVDNYEARMTINQATPFRSIPP